MQTLDVREIPPPERHPTIFGILDSLGTGESLVLVNDHDPAPLRHQLDATRPGHFEWTVVEAGPQTWRIQITSKVRLVDARPILEAGDEPFETIMDAVDELGDDEVLMIMAPFEPVPLEGVLGGQGFVHEAEELDSGDWRVTFRRA